MKTWISSLDEITDSFRSEFGNLSEADLNWKPKKNTWSIAQNIDHLIELNRSYFPIIQSMREGNFKMPLHGRINFVTTFLGKAVLQAVQPDRKRKMKTFAIWEPEKNRISGDILKRFEAHQEELKKVIRESQDLLDQGVVISSPANKNIVYKLSTAFDLIVAHEQRHFNQAKEVLELMRR